MSEVVAVTEDRTCGRVEFKYFEQCLNRQTEQHIEKLQQWPPY